MPPEHLGSRSLGGSLAGTRSRAKRKTNGPNGLDRGSEKSGCARTSENILARILWRNWPKKKPDSRGVHRGAVHVATRSRSGRSAGDRADALAPAFGQHLGLPRGLAVDRLHGTDGYILRVDDSPTPHGRIPRSGVLGRGPGRGDRGSPNDLGKGPRRRPCDLALHDLDARGDPPPFREVQFLESDRKRPRRGVVLARDLRWRPGGHAPHW